MSRIFTTLLLLAGSLVASAQSVSDPGTSVIVDYASTTTMAGKFIFGISPWPKLNPKHESLVAESGITILREATDFLEFLSTIPAANESEPGAIPFRAIRWYAEELQRMCSLSIEHRLPVVFYG